MFPFISKFLIHIYTYIYIHQPFEDYSYLQCMAISCTFLYTNKFIKFMCNICILHPCFDHNLIIKDKTHSPCVHVYIQNNVYTCQTLVISMYKNLIQCKELCKEIHLITSCFMSILSAKSQNYATRTGHPHVFETASKHMKSSIFQVPFSN
jgi:hypothetical protein